MAIVVPFHNFTLTQNNGNAISLATADIRLALIRDNVTPLATFIFWNSLATNEVTGGNYTQHGATLANLSVTLATTGIVKFDADDVSWADATAGFTDARYGILKVHNTDTATSRLIGYMDFGADKGNTATGGFSVPWSSLGIIRLRSPGPANVN